MPPQCPSERERWVQQLRRHYLNGTLDSYLFGKAVRVAPLLKAIAHSMPARNR